METPFENDPFALVYQAYRNLYDKPFIAYYDPNAGEDGKPVQEGCGFTDFNDGETPVVVVFTNIDTNAQVETFAHELAHVAVGPDHEHDDAWEAAFDAIFREYNRLGSEKFGPMGGQENEIEEEQ